MRFLLALKEDPLVKADALVGELGLSDRTIRRWWRTYNSEGLGVFLDYPEAMTAVAEQSVDYSNDGTTALMELLNSLPLGSDYEHWRAAVEGALTRYLGDVEEVELHIPAVLGESSATGPAEDREWSGRMIDVPVGDEEPLGRLRLITKGDTIDSVLAFVEELRPFLTFLFSDAVARFGALRGLPDRYVTELPEGPLVQSLSPRERDVLMLRLYGYTYAESADRLAVSEETIRKCVKNIYRKTNTESMGELFVRYFASVNEEPSI